MLKYHTQTSGRSPHAQEIQFNDIRTTLQALYALFDNCNSLHTNAYDEAVTTPTEDSVRRAIAIQLIINRELGLSVCENPWQGSFNIEKLTDIVEEAAYKEFEAISARGGVRGAMDTMYQRSKIQEEASTTSRRSTTAACPCLGQHVSPAGTSRRNHHDRGTHPVDRRRKGAADRECRGVPAPTESDPVHTRPAGRRPRGASPTCSRRLGNGRTSSPV